MATKHTLILLILFSVFSANAQNKNTVIFTIDNDSIYPSEFLRVYNKNLSIITDDNQKGINSYLELFVNYKLKVRQAYDLGLDTIEAYKTELSTYKRQLMEPYLKDNTVIDSLVIEAYNRSLIEINVSHIMARIDQRPGQLDTIRAYTKIQEAYAKIINGEEFNLVAKQYSEDPSVQNNNGNLGYFTVFDMVYPFESIAYTLPAGEISKPFQTRFGYHIIKVHNERAALGEVEAAHIMIKNDIINKNSKEKIDAIYARLNKGEDFGFLAKTVSEDVSSAKRDGNLGRFGSGKMVEEFENVVFSMKEIGSISQPFQTQYGWHIVKLINKFPIEDFESVKVTLTDKVKRGNRASLVSNSIAGKLEKKYTIVVNEDALSDVMNNSVEKNLDYSKIVLIIEDKEIGQNEFVKYLDNRSATTKLFNSFKKEKIVDYYKSHLEETNEEFAQSYQEYREGLLLFELLQTKIWNKSKDSLGLQNYFETHRSAYSEDKQLDDIKGQVINDYQAFLEKEWIDELNGLYNVVINHDVILITN